MSCTNNLVINSVNLFYGMEWKPNLTIYLIVHMHSSMYPMCSFAAHVCMCAGDKNIGCIQIHFPTKISYGEPPVLLLGLNMFKTRYYIRFASAVTCLY